MERPKCETCAYWDRDSDDSQHGDCLRHAPRPKLGDPTGDVSDYEAYWPDTVVGESCGEHSDFPEYLAHFRASRLTSS